MKAMNLFFLISAFSFSTFNAQAEFTDSLLNLQWGLKNIGQTIHVKNSDLSRKELIGKIGTDINFIDTASMPSTKSEIVVAVIDSGIDLNHPDLNSRIWYNSKLCKDAPNAKNLPCNGYNFLDNNTVITDEMGHGTHVAGIIAANRNNIGVMGSGDPRIKIMPLKVLSPSVGGFSYNNKLVSEIVADAMIFAIKNGAEVVNLSLGWPKIIDTPKVRAAFQMAEDQNVMVVAAAGNNNKDLPTFPCGYETVVCVGATDNQGELTTFTNHGSKVDVTAPGLFIVSTIPTTVEPLAIRIKGYDAKDGSSQAAPFVTASIATLKLLKPNLKNDEVRSILFASVNEANASQKRFVKYGALNQKRLIELADENRLKALPLIKDITEIKFNVEDKKFTLSIPVKNISSTDSAVDVCLRTKESSVSVDSECLHVDVVSSSKTQTFNFSGSLEDLATDSQVLFTVDVNGKSYKLPVFFTRDLNQDSNLKSINIDGGSFDDMAFISGGRKISRLIKIYDKGQLVANPEYFFFEKAKQSETVQTVSILKKISNSFQIKSLTFPKANKVVTIHRQDVNLDGRPDYMFYTSTADRKVIKLFFFDQDLNPLFGQNSEWTYDATKFGAFPDDAVNEKFDWMKINTPALGTILVPSIFLKNVMPEEDNSKNILDRDVAASFHQYVFIPEKNSNVINVKVRALDSIAAIKAFRKSIGIDSSYRIELIKPLPLAANNYTKGLVKLLAKVTNDDDTKFLVLTLKDGTITADTLSSALPLDGNAVYSIMDLNSNRANNDLVFTSLLNRSRANYVIASNTNVSYGRDIINGWDNPVLSLVMAVTNGSDRFFIMENRYTISFSDQNGTFKYELPIYRDSSFPKQNFSETLQPIFSDGNPGLFVNSTLILGERIYSMIGTKDGLKRPMSLSVKIPDGCAPMNPEFIDGSKDSQFMFICTDSNRSISIKYLSMSQK